MNYDKCYFDNEIKVRFFNFDENIEEYDVNNSENYYSYSDYYNLIYANGKEVKITLDNKIYTYNEPILIIIRPKLALKWYFVKQPFYRMRIILHPSFFRNVKNDKDVLEFFYKLNGDENVFKLNQPQFSSLQNYIDSIQTALFAKCGRFSMESRINALISELNLIYETNYKEYIASTDSITAQIFDYIDRHYLEKITLQDISDKFFVSINSVNAIIKRCAGYTFKQYIIFLRLNMANTLIQSGTQKLSDVAKLSGFSDYSSFIKAYKKRYGIVPSEAVNNKFKPFPLD